LPNNDRQQQFHQWIQASLPAAVEVPGPLKAQGLAGDAGFRRYYRLNTEPSLIAVDSPPAKENNPAYVNIAMELQSGELRTPIIHAVDFAQGYLLLEDFGDQLLQPLLNKDSVTQLYDLAESTLLKLQQLPDNRALFPRYDAQLLGDEMALFKQWFVSELLGVELQADDNAMLDDLFAQLIQSAQQQPQTLVHRDYHSRNLMLVDNNSLGVIDFQDAVWGPITYDLVSLLKDCYVRWPAQQTEQRAVAFKQRLGLSVDDQQFLRWFDLMGLQRHIKVMGIFARLALRDNKQGYFKDLPLVIEYSLEAAEQYAECHAFCRWFKQRINPLLGAHSWYQEPQRPEL
jgi:aminoglycoside/choline kinase family phosphotransferase